VAAVVVEVEVVVPVEVVRLLPPSRAPLLLGLLLRLLRLLLLLPLAMRHDRAFTITTQRK